MGVCCCHPSETPLWRETASECPSNTCVSNPLIDVFPNECTPEFCENNARSSCCFGVDDCTDDTFMNFALCRQQGGSPACPAFCGIIDCSIWIDDPEPGEFAACCLLDGTCEVLTQQACNAFNGDWRGTEAECAGVDCPVQDGCREINEPRWNDGDKKYTLQLCETAVMGFGKRRPTDPYYEEHPKAARGVTELVTTHETRACMVTGATADPCAHHYGALVKGADGYVRPALYSTPFTDDTGGGRWNVGVFTKQLPDQDDRVPRGYVHARVGVEVEPWSELLYFSTTQRCVGVS